MGFFFGMSSTGKARRRNMYNVRVEDVTHAEDQPSQSNDDPLTDINAAVGKKLEKKRRSKSLLSKQL